MKTIFDKQTGGRIEEDTQVFGMIVGDSVVSENVTLLINGMIVGSLTIEENAYVCVNGMVTDSIKSYGNLEINGMVIGKTEIFGGTYHIHADSKVNQLISYLPALD